MSIQDIPTEKIAEDRASTMDDIWLCETAIRDGVLFYGAGDSVEDRLATDRKVLATIDAELARHRADLHTAQPAAAQSDPATFRRFPAGTPARCNRCNASVALPVVMFGRRLQIPFRGENSNAWRLTNVCMLPCGHLDAHWVMDTDLPQEPEVA